MMRPEGDETIGLSAAKGLSVVRASLHRAMQALGRDLAFTVGVVAAGLLAMAALALGLLEL